MQRNGYVNHLVINRFWISSASGAEVSFRQDWEKRNGAQLNWNQFKLSMDEAPSVTT